MADDVLEGSLSLLSRLLYRHYGQRVIILIDEYDVPLDKAQHLGYYDDMVGIIRHLFGQALKTNENLSFAVLTGLSLLRAEPDALPRAFWINTSGNGILLGLLSYREDWDVYSNAESGDGFGDILVETEDQRMGIVIELKCPVDGVLETACEKALAQIEEKGYEKRLRLDGMETILKYGIACRKKECRVRLNPPPSL